MQPEVSCDRGDEATGTGRPQDLPYTLRNRSVFIETYGCRYNFGDSAKLVEILRHRGCDIVENVDDADAVVVNTCTVVGPTERRMLRRLSMLKDRDLYVTGCMVRVQRETILGVCSPAIIDPAIIHDLYMVIGTVAKGSVGIVQLAQGCAGHCTYCITRLARGPLKSIPADEILAHLRAFVSAGTTEIQLTAQDVSAWGLDTGDSLPDLLSSLDEIPGNHRIRIGMMNPATVKEQSGAIADVLRGEHFFRFVHLPVQSGSDTVLARMGRRYTIAEFEGIVRLFRERCPGITISTDIIVGFCGETDDEFAESLDLIRRVKPAKVNVTRYSPRPFTPRHCGKDIADALKKDRSRLMDTVAREVYASVNADLIGKITPFIVTEVLRKGSVMARSPDYTGIVLREDLPVGTCGEAIIRKDRGFFFIGERIRTP